MSYLGLGLLTVAPLWVLWENPARHHVEPLWAAVLAAEALAMAALAAVLARLVDIGRVSGQTAADGRGELTGAAEGSATALYRVPLLQIGRRSWRRLRCFWEIGTAWRDWEAILAAHSLAMVAATVCITACYMLLAWQYRSPERTWAGSMVALAGLIHAVVWNYPDVVQQPWLMALLTHATLATLASLVVGEWGKRRATDGSAGELRRVFAAPLGDTAVLSSLLTLPVLPFVSWPCTESLAGLPLLAVGDLARDWLAAPRRPVVRRPSIHAGGRNRRGHHRLAQAAVLGRKSARRSVASLQSSRLWDRLGRPVAALDRRPNRPARQCDRQEAP